MMLKRLSVRLSVVTMMVGLAGCGVAPEDLFHLRGRVVAQGAAETKPEPGLRVALGRGRPRGKLFSAPCVTTKDVGASVTDEVGQFAFELFRAELELPEASADGAACLRLGAEVDGVSTWVDVENERQTRNTELGTLWVWRPDASLSEGPSDAGLVLGFETPPAVPDCVAQRVRATFGVDGGVWWDAVFELTDAGTGRVAQAIPPQWLEDRKGTLRLEAGAVGSVMVAQSLGLTLDLEPTRARLARFGALAETRVELEGQLTPQSRGAACPGFPSPCPLTDGDPSPVSMDGGTVIELELAAPAVVRTVVVRALRYVPMPLKLSFLQLVDRESGERRMIAGFGADGGLVGPPGEGLPTYGMPLFSELDGHLLLGVDPPLPASARYQLVFALPVEQLAEVSLFGR